MKKIKGFTLIECLIALAILGIASLTMAEIYANISRINMNNHMVNTSLSYQMQMVENKTSTEAVKIPSGETASQTAPPHTRTNVKYVRFEKLDATGAETGEVYSYPVDCYVLLSRDRQNQNSTVSTEISESDMNLRYKYITGYTN